MSITSQTKPAEKMRSAISDRMRSSGSFANAFLSGFRGSRLTSTLAPPLRFSARARIDLNETFAIYSSQPSKKSNTLALNRPCAIIEK